MRKVVLFIAMSLDGYIADGNGGVAWLNGHGNDNENIDTYTEFTKDIDTVLMGWNTSHQVVTELSPQEWVYNKFTTYVLTHKECNSSQQIHFTSENPVLLLERLKQEAGKDIWICGGANLVQQLVSKNMIDPTTLAGKSLRFFRHACKGAVRFGGSASLRAVQSPRYLTRGAQKTRNTIH